MSSSNVCILIPTRNHAEMLSENLSYFFRHYADVDVNIYDSSEDEDTENVVLNFIKLGCNNIKYRRMDQNLCLDYKLVDILRNDKSILLYKYVWLINDSISILPDAMCRIKSYLEDDYDLVRLPSPGYGIPEDQVFTNQNDWFIYASRNMAHMATTIMNSRLLCGEIDWIGLREKYVGKNDILDENHGFFFTVGFYLERIATIDDFRGLLIGNDMRWWRESTLKQGKSYWQNLIFATWARSYCETIFSLPDCYRDKEKVIYDSDNIHCGRFGEQSLISYRIHGLFSINDVAKYGKYWHLISNVPMERFKEIAMTPIDELRRGYGDHYGELSCWKDNLSKIEKELDNCTLIVYGAGLYGNNAVRKLLSDGYEILAVAVSNANTNPPNIEGVPVRCILDMLDMKDEAMILIAAMPDTANEIHKDLIRLGFKRIRSLF